MPDYLLQELGDRLLLENSGTDAILLEDAAATALRQRTVRGNMMMGQDDYLISYQG